MEWFYIAFASAILSAIAAVLQKKVLFNLDALEFSFILSIFNLLLALILLPQLNYSQITATALIILYLKTILGAFAFLNVMLAIKNLEISGALPLMVLTPGIVAVLSLFFLGESITNLEIYGMILLLIGTYVLEIKKHDKLLDPIKTFFNSKYHKYIFYALILFSVSSVIDKLIVKDYKLTPFNFVVFQQIFLGINFTVLILLRAKNPFQLMQKVSKDNLIWILLIAFLTFGYRYAQIEAVKIAPVALVLSIKRTSVLFASIFGGKLFSESQLLKKGIAIGLMLIGAYLLNQNI
ncbi:MAG: EamA family transporter [Ignavibacteriae bacterium]|nr:EamA family transporter [Ignavibacteriota bacterium]